jgi:hypothetical protein
VSNRGRFNEEGNMHPEIARVQRKVRPATVIAVLTILAFALGGCATGTGSNPGVPASEPVTYVGVFTGKFVDGMPLYQFPPIYVVGSRRSAAPDL